MLSCGLVWGCNMLGFVPSELGIVERFEGHTMMWVTFLPLLSCAGELLSVCVLILTFNSKCLMALLDVLLMLSLKMGCLLTMMAKAGLFKWFNFPDYIGEAFDLANPTHIPIIPANS